MLENRNINELVAEARGGSQSAMSILYEANKRTMFGICIRMTGSGSDAEDVLQEAFVNAFTHLKQLKKSENFGAWLRRIVINECIRFARTNFQWTELNEVTVESEGDQGEDESWFYRVDLQTIYAEIKGLPNGYRQIFNLFAIEDFSHREIAEKLGISESTSKSQYHKAKRLLRERLLNKIQHGQL